MENQEIINSWTLQGFCHVNGNPKFASLKNKETGNTFFALMFNDGQKMVSFSQKMVDANQNSIKYIQENKNNLNVIQLESGNYKLCNRPDSSWQELDLF